MFVRQTFTRRLAPIFQRRVKAKTSLQDDDVPIDDTTTKPIFTPLEKGRKGTRDRRPRLRWNPWQNKDCIKKQRVWIEFCFKIGKTTSESFQMLKVAFKEAALSQLRIFEWCARFKAGRTSLKDDLHTGRPLSIRNPKYSLKIKSSIKEDPRITIKELPENLDIAFGTCQTIIKNDLHLKRSPAKFVPHLLMNEQKELRKET
ncbi:hypothetical protein LAZ67_X002024 [Cordylochernes scorpioides]|uniref:Mos1 transposase HTH domain-containing protein n=1 Tax=Cordylochernes scorpioides TaxID=51811 RepID=A0ABY6LT24_9ARAC|nr:hypothetical protein LAZ67_X002024 [Cordylochernes scorpioides]